MIVTECSVTKPLFGLIELFARLSSSLSVLIFTHLRRHIPTMGLRTPCTLAFRTLWHFLRSTHRVLQSWVLVFSFSSSQTAHSHILSNHTHPHAPSRHTRLQLPIRVLTLTCAYHDIHTTPTSGCEKEFSSERRTELLDLFGFI